MTRRPWLSLALVLLAGPLPAQAPVTVTGSIAWLAGADSTVKLGTALTVSGFIPGDTVRYEYYRGTARIGIKRTRALRDSLITAAPAYGASQTFKGCAQVERGGRASGVKYPATAACWTWTYTRPVPAGAIDSIWRLANITLRPLGPPLAVDSARRCGKWQAANPGRSVWANNSVNVRAVAACTASDERLVVWQFCAFAEYEDTAHHIQRVLTVNSASIPYCVSQFQRWLAEASS